MNEYLKGPWTAFPISNNSGFSIRFNGKQIAKISKSNEQTDDEKKQIASLMIEAPDMFRVLKGIVSVRCCQPSEIDGDLSCHYCGGELLTYKPETYNHLEKCEYKLAEELIERMENDAIPS